MAADQLPFFRYHPEPLSTGSVVRETIVCSSCDLERGLRYVGPMYGRSSAEPVLCPWCIGDGRAADRFGIEFTDRLPLASLSVATQDEVVLRTPGYTSWQQEQWQHHCGDACAFLGAAGVAELKTLPEGATAAVRARLSEWGTSEAERDHLLACLHRDGDLSAYLFRCLRCDAYAAAVDSS